MVIATLDRPPTEANRPYRPYGAAEQVLYRHDGELVIAGPAGTGKSRACLEKLHLCAEKYKGMRGLIARKTRESLTQSALVTFEQKVLPLGTRVKLHHESQEYRYPNGSVLVLGGLDKASKIMSTEYDLAYVQEATELTEHDWESITTRLRHGVMPYQQLLADCNPDAPTHWLKQRADRGQCALLDSRHEDNPTVTADYLAKLDKLTGVRFQRLRLGQWAAAEGLVYTPWDRALHLVDAFEIPADWPRYWAVDFGYTNPFVWQAWAEDPDGRLYRYREIHMSHRLVEDHAKDILTATQGEPRPRVIVCDHDAEGRATLEKHLGMPTTPAYKAVTEGIQAVTVRLRPAGDGQPRLFFLRGALVERDPVADDVKRPACTEEEVESYCLVAGTLVMTADGERPIAEVCPGDLVWTRSGLRQVLAARMTAPSAQVWTARFSNGRKLTGTADHPVFVQIGGWVSLASLSYSDIIEAWMPPSSSLTGLPIAATRTLKRGLTAITSGLRHLIEQGGIATYTSTYGGQPTGMCLQGATSTIATITRSTTASTIWSVLRRASIWQRIGAILSAAPRLGSPNWTRPGSWLLSSHVVQQAAILHGAGSGASGQSASLPIGRVSSAGPGFLAGLLARPGSARAPVTLHGVRPSGATSSSVSARSVTAALRWISGRHKPAAPVRVVSVTVEPKAVPVYNLTVEGRPEYYANGVLVHNCWDTSNNRKRGEEPVKKDDHGMDATRYLVAHLDLRPPAAWNFF